MILSDGDIIRRLEEGDLVIEPLDDPDLQIQPASVDFRLGREFLEFKRTNITCIHPDRGEEVEKYVSETIVPPGGDQTTLGEEDGPGEFILHPGDFVLGTTKERVEIPDDLIAHVEGRSSLGRLAIVVHASLPSDEEIFLWTPDEGFGFYEIGAIVEDERSARAVSFDPRTLRVRTHQVTDYITNPTKRIYRVTLQSGREVHVTQDHNLFTLDARGGVTRIPSEEAEGQLVMVPDSIPEPQAPKGEVDLLALFDGADDVIAYATDGLGRVDWDRIPSGSHRYYRSKNSAPVHALSRASASENVELAFKQSDLRLPRHLPVTEEFGWVLGFYIAEGSVRRKQVFFGSTEESYLDRVAAWFERFDTGVYRYEYEDKDYEILTVSSALWSKLIQALAGSGREKTIPDEAWNWSNGVLAALLDGLLDGDGSRREHRDTLFTSNPQLANRTMYLASRLGLLSSMYSREREIYIEPSDVTHSGTHWAVDISEGAHKRGQYVPIPSELLHELRVDADMDLAQAAKTMGFASKSSITNVEQEHYKSVKRSTLRTFRDAYAEAGADTTRLDQLLDGDVRFDRVVSVEETDRVEPTYDLEVQPNGRAIENFLGGRGGIFLSNTAGIVDPGYRGQITLELSNLGSAPVALQPGMRISQLTFTELKNPAQRPYGSDRGSKYQDQTGPQASRIGGDDEFAGDQT